MMVREMKKIILSCLIAVIFLFSGCENADNNNVDVPHATKEIFAMDTYMTLTAYGEQAEKAVDEAVVEIKRLDKLLSVGEPDSEVYHINSDGKGTLSEDVQLLLEKSSWIYNNTGGTYDITVYPLMKLWGFTEEKQSVPSQKEIDKVLGYIGFDKLHYADGEISLAENQGIDFGGIAKGYTGERIMQIFEKYDVISGVISLGGNVQCFGAKTDGSLWKCGITDPDNPQDSNKLLGIVSVRDKAVITSGGYERFFEENGKTYHHIMDVKTGYPSKSGLRSVTIVSNDGTLADGLSTACFVMGKEKAVSFWEKHKDKFDMILMTDENRIFVTEGIAGNFSSERDFERIA